MSIKGPGSVKTLTFFWHVEFPSLGDTKATNTRNIRREGTTEKTILNSFCPGTFSYSLG